MILFCFCLRICLESGGIAEKSNGLPPLAQSKKRCLKSSPENAWGRLISQSFEDPHVPICEPIYTVGQCRQCNLWLKDPNVSTVLCKLSHIEHGGSSVALLEVIGSKDLSLISPPANTGKNTQQNTDIFSLPAGDGDDKANVDVKHNTVNNEPDGVFYAEETGCPSSTTLNEDPKVDVVEVNISVDADVGNMTAASSNLRPLFCPDLDLSGKITKILEKNKELPEHLLRSRSLRQYQSRSQKSHR
ncbi:hypothetical protein RYX36_000250 [Vicia faba]